MPTPTKYTFSIVADTANGKVAADALAVEIQTSAIITALDHIDTIGANLDVWFKDVLSAPDEATLASVVAAHEGVALPDNTPRPTTIFAEDGVKNPVDPDGRLRFVLEKTIGSKANFFTHNFCDKTTWYQSSIYVEDETATNSGDDTTYNLAHQFVIDTYHGKLNQEDYLVDSSDRSYRVTVKVDGVTKVERDPHYAAVGGGPAWDYTVNYAAGTVTFQAAQSPSAVVTVTYHYASTATDGSASRYKIVPQAGKKIRIDMAKVQFSDDVDLRDTIMFQVWGYVDYFASQLLIANGGPYPPGTKIPIQYFPYKTLNDFAEDSHRPDAAIKAIGQVGNWRSGSKDLRIYRWDYLAGNSVNEAAGMEVWVYLVHDNPVIGTRATATFYSIAEKV